jgi:hypothetical protein
VRLRGSLRGRVGAIQDWLERRVDSKLGRLSLAWFRAYFEASQNSGSAATLYMFLSVAPTMLAVVGVLNAAGANTNAFADRIVAHLHLTGRRRASSPRRSEAQLRTRSPPRSRRSSGS